MKYKLLKDLPVISAGKIAEVDDGLVCFGNGGTYDYTFTVEHVRDNHDWFEPIEDKPQRYRAQPQEYYFFLDEDFNPCESTEALPSTTTNIDDGRYKRGNYFRTFEQADLFGEAVKSLAEYVHSPEDWPDGATPPFIRLAHELHRSIQRSRDDK